jgi:hypothetical protein
MRWRCSGRPALVVHEPLLLRGRQVLHQHGVRVEEVVAEQPVAVK